jgi:hypothetical protein
MDDAIKRVKQLAASALVRKEKLEEELRVLEEEKANRARQQDLASRSGDEGVAMDLQSLMVDLEARLSAKRDEIAEADAAFREIMADLDTTKQAKDDYARAKLRAPIDAAASPDPFAMSAEDVALDNVRRSIEGLSAEAELGDDLQAEGPQRAERAKAHSRSEAEASWQDIAGRRSEAELSRKIAELEQKEKADKALAQLAELKAKKRQKAGGQAKADAAPDAPESPEPPKKPKKTM